MRLIKATQRNVTMLAWLLSPYIFLRNLSDYLRDTADDVGHLIDTFRPFADYEGEGRGPSVRDTPKG